MTAGPIVFLGGRVALHLGDVRAVLASMPEASVDCVVTSPPYWGLRDYGVTGQIGLEPTLGEHLAVMVEVFDLVRRVLKPEGTLWLNYGDCYATKPNGRSAADTKAAGGDDRTFRDKPFSTIGPIHPTQGEEVDRGKRDAPRWGGRNNPTGGYLKPKDLCMIPNRLAIALQDAGWWVRSEIVWAKTNPMPDGAKDRPAVSHEKVFLLTKSARYFYDPEAVRFGVQPKTLTTYGTRRSDVADDGAGKVKKAGMAQRMPVRRARAVYVASSRHAGHINHTGLDAVERGSRNLRNYEPADLDVWPIATRAFREAHFATFPPELARRCILAGCPHGGTVLDPFGGAGTTALVALRHGRKAQLVELNPEYGEIARRRIEREWRQVRAISRPKPPAPSDLLFATHEAAE